MAKEMGVWKTKDISIAAFMAVAGPKWLRADPIEDGQGKKNKFKMFVFEDEIIDGVSTCESLKQDYIAARPTTKMVARKLMDQYRAFRSLSFT